uniref:Uncharacterized protein n=1 Tax=Anguilla anguilla TaxID=7936 RepID=A0A0E9S9G0_ANGAN
MQTYVQTDTLTHTHHSNPKCHTAYNIVLYSTFT